MAGHKRRAINTGLFCRRSICHILLALVNRLDYSEDILLAFSFSSPFDGAGFPQARPNLEPLHGQNGQGSASATAGTPVGSIPTLSTASLRWWLPD